MFEPVDSTAASPVARKTWRRHRIVAIVEPEALRGTSGRAGVKATDLHLAEFGANEERNKRSEKDESLLILPRFHRTRPKRCPGRSCALPTDKERSDTRYAYL